MKERRSDPPRDEEIDALLGRRYRDTSPEFEARWVALKRELRQAPAGRRAWLAHWNVWMAIGAVAAVVAVSFGPWGGRETAIAGAEISPALAEMLTMEPVLSRATALLDPENREALLNLSAASKP